MRKAFVALALLVVAPLAPASVEPLQLPEPVTFPEFVDSIQVSGALVNAFTAKKWTVEKDTGEAVTASRVHRRLRLRVRIDYDNHQVTYHYLDSDNFYGEDDAQTGGVLIHRKANAWLRELGDAVRLQMQPLIFARDPAQVVPVTPAAPAPPESPPGE